MSTDTTETTRDNQTRRGWVGTVLTFLCPGLGYMYVGRIGRGLLVNFLFIAVLVAAIAVVTVYGIFPLWPLAVLAIGWGLCSWLTSRSIREIIDERERAFEPESYNHWTVYSAVSLLTYGLPVVAVLVFTHQFLWTLHTVRDASMYPNLLPGDVVLVDRRTYEDHPPEHGDLVAFEGESSTWSIARTAARPGDNVRVEGYALHVNGEARSRTPMPSEAIRIQSSLVPSDPFELMVERNQKHRYAIAVVPSSRFETGFHSDSLEDRQLYLLADNRNKKSGPFEASTADIRDSRDFGPIAASTIRGKPTHIAWSFSTGGGMRWNRIGIRLR